MLRLVLVLAGLFLPALAGAQEGGQRLVTGLSTNRIAITSNFTGTEIVLFGAVEGLEPPRDYDVVVVIEGPRRDTTVRRKDRLVGIWMNAEARELQNAPTSLYIITSAPLSAIATPEVINEEALSLESRMPLRGESDETGTFRQALIRLKERRALYGMSIGGVEFLSDVLFRASVTVPAAIPVGLHSAEIYLLRGAEVIGRDDLSILIEKQGVEEAAHTLAVDYAFVYGILAVIMAFVMGWLANVIFRKD